MGKIIFFLLTKLRSLTHKYPPFASFVTLLSYYKYYARPFFSLRFFVSFFRRILTFPAVVQKVAHKAKKLLTVMPGVKLFLCFFQRQQYKRYFGIFYTEISFMTKNLTNPDSVKNHKHSSSVFPHHCRMVLEYLM